MLVERKQNKIVCELYLIRNEFEDVQKTTGLFIL